MAADDAVSYCAMGTKDARVLVCFQQDFHADRADDSDRLII